MIADEAQARDEIFGLLNVAWLASAASEVKILWQGVSTDSPPDGAVAYARATVLHGTSVQSALAGASSARRYTSSGVVMVQCFGPLADGGLDLAVTLARVARGAFEGKATPGGVWFRNCRINEVGPDANWFQVNMVADFQYDSER